MSSSLFDFSDPNLYQAAAAIIAAPTIWNVLARIEYKTHLLTVVALKNKYFGCYMLALYIFSFSLFRDFLFHKTLQAQPRFHLGENQFYVDIFSYIIGVIGFVLVSTSMWALGVTGTYLGDYFGILMDAPVTGFPFNVTNNPMYDGATLLFIANSIRGSLSPAGLALSALVYICYRIACLFEEPFTAYIYQQRDEQRKKAH